MAGKREAIREDLTKRLLAAAVKRVEEHGLGALRARDITSDAGCGLGTIYKCYADLDDVIINVNSQTLGQLHEAMRAAVKGADTPLAQLKALAFTYLDFALDNKNLWSALFDHILPDEQEAPEWHKKEIASLLSLIGKALKAIDPKLDEAALSARTRTYFAAVHGVVSLSLDDRFVSVSGEALHLELDNLVERLA
ncbi:MAG: TetR/AcrR family transcriptional regulator [Stappiaceae bacterium]